MTVHELITELLLIEAREGDDLPVYVEADCAAFELEGPLTIDDQPRGSCNEVYPRGLVI